MLVILIMISGLFFAIIAPAITLFKYYHPSEFTPLQNIFWFIVTVITWPLVPLIMATRRKDMLLIGLFWISFIVMAGAAWYWTTSNIHQLMQVHHIMQQHVMQQRM